MEYNGFVMSGSYPSNQPPLYFQHGQQNVYGAQCIPVPGGYLMPHGPVHPSQQFVPVDPNGGTIPNGMIVHPQQFPPQGQVFPNFNGGQTIPQAPNIQGFNVCQVTPQGPNGPDFTVSQAISQGPNVQQCKPSMQPGDLVTSDDNFSQFLDPMLSMFPEAEMFAPACPLGAFQLPSEQDTMELEGFSNLVNSAATHVLTEWEAEQAKSVAIAMASSSSVNQLPPGQQNAAAMFGPLSDSHAESAEDNTLEVPLHGQMNLPDFDSISPSMLPNGPEITMAVRPKEKEKAPVRESYSPSASSTSESDSTFTPGTQASTPSTSTCGYSMTPSSSLLGESSSSCSTMSLHHDVQYRKDGTVQTKKDGTAMKKRGRKKLPLTDEQRVERRKEKGRGSAKKCREKKRLMEAQKLAQADAANNIKLKLYNEVKKLEEEASHLRALVAQHAASGNAVCHFIGFPMPEPQL
ncbi:hypothetical protein B0J14DRAFT_650125 [Halenospora varia]|nr:hypothetical protein B0J14DRAFT_650125 [Halenospora varia]